MVNLTRHGELNQTWRIESETANWFRHSELNQTWQI